MSARPLCFDGVSKGFKRGQRVDSLRDLIPRIAGRLLRRPPTGDAEWFWALDDVSVEVEPGQVLGVIGPNGSGKSTFLKLASRIMAPDRGRIEVHGRVGALIELAAGFHGELTGRENVFFQGAVMGLPRALVAERFDEIVDFAGVGPFIDTPVKRYSSGMSARLGFSIAVHMDPDVLLIDEVLAVGDLEFQQRAAERLSQIVAREIPVVVVSHQLDRIVELADVGVFLHGGRIRSAGSIEAVVRDYVDGVHFDAGEGDAGVLLGELGGVPTDEVEPGSALSVEVSGTVLPGADPERISVGVLVRTLPDERTLFATHNVQCGVPLPEAGPFRIAFDLDFTVGGGLYRVQAFVWDRVDRRETARLSADPVRVRDDGRIFGRVHLNPRARRLDGTG